jgi:hypothetical protein
VIFIFLLEESQFLASRRAVEHEGNGAAQHLCNDIEQEGVDLDLTVHEHHEGHSGVEVATADGAKGQNGHGQGGTNAHGVGRSQDNSQEHKGAQELGENGEHGSALVVYYILWGRFFIEARKALKQGT